MKKADKFDAGKWLVENKLTSTSKLLREDDYQDFLNSLNIDTSDVKDDSAIEIGDSVATVRGQGTVIDIDIKNEMYIVDIGKSKPFVTPFGGVRKLESYIENDNLLISDINELEKEHKSFQKNFVNLDFSSSNALEDFKSEYWKLPKICDFYLELGKKMWKMFKQNSDFIENSDEFEDLFFEVLNFLVSLQKIDKKQNEELNTLVSSYEQIGDRLGAGVR
jgi:hypothetical protein